MKRYLFVLLFPVLFCGNILAHGIFDSLPSFGASAGLLVFHGAVGKNNNVSSLSAIRAGFSVFGQEQVHPYFDVALSGLFGNVSNVPTAQTEGLNFETKIAQADLSLIFHTEKLFPKSSVTPYAGIGFGFLGFTPYGDLYNNNGELYYYWSDGSIRNQAQNSNNMYTAKILVLNYKFTTPLDPDNTYSHHTLIFPLQFGFNFNLLDNLNVRLGMNYYYTLSPWLDNVKGSGANDSYIYWNVAIAYTLKRHPIAKSRADDRRYDKVDFSQFDADFPKPEPAKK